MNKEGLKATDIHRCVNCNGKHIVDIYQVRVRRHIANPRVIQKHVGLSMQLGNELLATVIGGDEDMTVPIEECEVLICQDCFLKSSLGAQLFSFLQGEEEQDNEPDVDDLDSPEAQRRGI